MNLLKQFCIVLAVYFFGLGVQFIFKLPIPGNVIGMLILLVALSTGIIKLEAVEEISQKLLDNLPVFFIPAGVGIIASFVLLKTSGIQIGIIIFLTTVIIMGVTGKIVDIVKGGSKK